MKTSRLTTGAVGDGEGGGLRDGVGLAGVGDLGGLRAVGGVGGDDLSHVGGASAVLGGDRGGGNASQSGGGDGSSETHFDIRELGWLLLGVLRVVVVVVVEAID